MAGIVGGLTTILHSKGLMKVPFFLLMQVNLGSSRVRISQDSSEKQNILFVGLYIEHNPIYVYGIVLYTYKYTSHTQALSALSPNNDKYSYIHRK